MNTYNGDWWSRQPDFVKACCDTLQCSQHAKTKIKGMIDVLIMPCMLFNAC